MSGQRDWDAAAFRAAYVADGGSAASARSYVSYLNRAERVLGGLVADDLVRQAERLPSHAWGGERERRDSLAALRAFVQLQGFPCPAAACVQDGAATTRYPSATLAAPTKAADPAAVLHVLAQAQRLGADYYRLTGKPLGVTGEVAEYEAARLLGLELCGARTPGHDAIDPTSGERVQVKGRAVDAADRYRGMCPAILTEGAVDTVVLVLLDRTTLTALEMWRADITSVRTRIAGLTSQRRRGNGTLAITQFRSIAVQVA